ncbi:MAG: UbiD family decarboxylase [Planctomycetes bacterium]|nr:UbiD family decarboxylase [Planctomycetota bacterium]
MTGTRNCSMYRLQRHDKADSSLPSTPHRRRAAPHLQALRRDRMPVAIMMGGASPQVVFSTVAPLPPGIDEVLFAKPSAKRPVQMVESAARYPSVPADTPSSRDRG